MLEGQTGEVQQWLAGVRKSYGVIPVMLPAVAWNDDLTPWPAGPIFKKGKSFGGEAEAYLNRLAAEIIPGLEKELAIVPEERWFVGVSLAGLFGVWSAARMRLFTRVAAISGGWAGGSAHITAVNASAGVMTTFGDRYNTTGHELFHQLQHELSHGKDVDERSLFWLEEGSADYIGAALADSLGGKPLWKWQLDVKAALLRARSTVKPTALQHCDFEQHKKLISSTRQ